MVTVWIREGSYFFSPFSPNLVHLAAAQLLDPSEGAARNGQLPGLGKGRTSPFGVCVLGDCTPTGEIVHTCILHRVFYFSDRSAALHFSFSLAFFFPPVLCHHLLPAFPASCPILFAKPISFFIAAAFLFETSKVLSLTAIKCPILAPHDKTDVSISKAEWVKVRMPQTAVAGVCGVWEKAGGGVLVQPSESRMRWGN